MSQKKLLQLIVVALVLLVIYFVAVPGSEPTTKTSERQLFAGVNAQDVSQITIEQGTTSLKLVDKDGAWQLPDRNGYPADSGKIHALLLKIFDLTVSQRIPGDADSQQKLGVADASVKDGLTHISLLNKSGVQLAGLHVGQARKTKDKSPMGALSGQYVRRDGEDDIYLLGAPFTLTTTVPSWLDVNLINLAPTAVRSVAQAKNSDSGQELLFELVRTGENDNAGLPKFTLKDGVPEGKVLQEPVLTQIRGGIENLRIADVHAADSAEVKDLKFDMSTFYRSMNGLVYRVDSVQSGEKYFVKLGVVFDPALAKEIQDEAAAKAQATPTPQASPAGTPSADGASSSSAEASPSPTPTPSSHSTPSPTPTPKPEVVISNDEEAKKLSAQYQPWVYELPLYAAKKFRYSKTEVIEAPPPPVPQQAPQGLGGQGMGAPGMAAPGAIPQGEADHGEAPPIPGM